MSGNCWFYFYFVAFFLRLDPETFHLRVHGCLVILPWSLSWSSLSPQGKLLLYTFWGKKNANFLSGGTGGKSQIACFEFELSPTAEAAAEANSVMDFLISFFPSVLVCRHLELHLNIQFSFE